MDKDTPIRLLVPTGIYPPDIGGPATYVPLLEEHLPALGFVVDVLPFGRFRHLPKVASHISYFFSIFSHARRTDIVYAQDALSVGWPSFLAAYLLRRAFVVKIVGDHVWEQGRQRFGVTVGLDEFPRWPRHPYLLFLRALQFLVARNATQVIVPSNYLKKIVLGWGVTESRVAVVYNGISLPEHTRKTVNMPHPLVVAVGRLTPWKEFTGIIRATAQGNWHLVLIGEGPSRQEIEALIQELGLQQRVKLTGSLPREEMLGFCKEANVFVLNSSYEGLPHTLIEVMMLGVPVVVSDIPGNREVAEDSSQAAIVPMHNDKMLTEAIQQTLEFSPEIALRVATAKRRAEKFTVAATVAGLSELLKKVCA
ncbi:MAG: glycosyltransferase family 4 protein [Patescibacteria group bacterium]